MSFEKTRVALTTDRAIANVGFEDVPELIAKFVVLDDDSLVTFTAQGSAELPFGAGTFDLKFMLQRDDDAVPAFAELSDTGARGNYSYTVVAALANTPLPVYAEQTRKLAAGRYTVKLQGSSRSAAPLGFEGIAANGAPFEMCVEVENNDALTAAGQDARHVAGQF